MRIAIDISSVVYGTGVSVYTRELATNLLEIDEKNEYVLYGGSLRRSGEIERFLTTLKGVSLQGRVFPVPPTLADIVWNRLHILPVERLIGKVDVLHSSDWTQPPSGAYKVTTVHDLVPIKYPEWSSSKTISVHKRRLAWVKKEVDRIVVPSKQTRNDLVDLGFDNEKIKVIYEAGTQGVTEINVEKIKNLKKTLKISGKFLLSVGVGPRKNTRRIIEAFGRLIKDEMYKGFNLVFVGHPVGVEVKESGSVKFLGYVEEEVLSGLYSGAEALVYPSLYEGFGIPILDAMKCGTPVVTSNIGSMKEVAGNAAVLVDPKKTASIVKGIKRIIGSKEIFIAKGKKRAKMFSWQKMAKKTLDLYEQSN